MNSRKAQAKLMMVTPKPTSQFETDKFKVKSQSEPSKHYIVSRTGNGLVCECPDNQYRKSDCKHIHVILDIIKSNKCYANNEFKIMDEQNLISANIVALAI